ncbi:MAG: hypothetical protein ACTSWW_01575, partial [Promethearchaeota archaeon]
GQDPADSSRDPKSAHASHCADRPAPWCFRGEIRGFVVVSRTGKQFRCTHMRSKVDAFHPKFELDADLNAARNVSMRPVIRVLS